MAQYPLQTPAHAGLQLALAAPGGASGDTVQPVAGAELLVQTTGTITTVTLPFASGLPKTDGLAVASRTFACAATGIAVIPIPPAVYGTALQAVNYSSVTGVSVAYKFTPTT